jgi:hypothetical protein
MRPKAMESIIVRSHVGLDLLIESVEIGLD